MGRDCCTMFARKLPMILNRATNHSFLVEDEGLIGALATSAGCPPSLSFSKQHCRAVASFRSHGSEIAATCKPWTRAVQSGTTTSPAHTSAVRARTTTVAEMAMGSCLRPLLRRGRRPPELIIVTASRVSSLKRLASARQKSLPAPAACQTGYARSMAAWGRSRPAPARQANQ